MKSMNKRDSGPVTFAQTTQRLIVLVTVNNTTYKGRACENAKQKSQFTSSTVSHSDHSLSQRAVC